MTANNEQVQALLDRLAKIAPDRPTRRFARKALARSQMPMKDIIAKIPGDSIIEKAEYLGITRQSIYGWLEGISRPNNKRAKQIAKVTGLAVDAIRGRAPDAA